MAKKSTSSIIQTSYHASPSPNLLLGANVVLLGSHLRAAFMHDTNGYQILVMPTDDAGALMSLQEMVNQVNNLIKGIQSSPAEIPVGDITTQLSGVVPDSNDSILDSISVQLKQAFLYIKKLHDVDGKPNPANIMEYAIDIELICSIAPGFEILNLDTLSFTFWNTTRTAILERMNIKKLEELLAETNKPVRKEQLS